MSKRVKVAVLDSGLDTKTYFELFNENITEGYSLCTEEKNPKKKGKIFEDLNGHGTACAVKIKEIAPDAIIVPVKILLDDGRGSIEWLVEALKLVNELDVQVVNMSISSDIDELRKMLKPILEKLKRKGITCIASKSNTRRVSIPAEMTNVIGVGSSQEVFETNYQYCNKDGINIVASGAPELLGYSNRLKTFFKGNSRATAIITGLLADYISNSGTMKSQEDLIRYLKSNSKNSKEQLYGIDMSCKNKEIEAVVANTITKLLQEEKINMVLENDTDLNYSLSSIEDFYKIVMELERVFKCNILGNTTVYMKYFQAINNLSRLVEVSRK